MRPFLVTRVARSLAPLGSAGAVQGSVICGHGDLLSLRRIVLFPERGRVLFRLTLIKQLTL